MNQESRKRKVEGVVPNALSWARAGFGTSRSTFLFS
jgi:hypothetical protein